MSLKSIINNLPFFGKNKRNTEEKKPSTAWRIIRACLGVIPAVFIEVIAYLTLRGEDVSAAPRHVIITHVAAALCLLLPLTTLIKVKLHAVIRWSLTTLKWIPVLISPPAAFFMLEFLTHNPFDNGKGGADMSDNVILFNISFFVIALFTLIFITGRTAPAVITVTALPLTLGLISYFTLEFRGTPLFPWDIASYGIASTVVGGYDLTLTPMILMIIALALLTCVVAIVWNVRIRFPWSKVIRPIIALAMCFVMVSAVGYVQTDRAISDFRLYPYLFTPGHLYKTNGFTVSFLMNLRYATVEKPEGYSDDEAESIASTYESDSTEDSQKRPNIIVIMNESFADMSELAPLLTNIPVMPFISSLEENTVKGTLHSSVVGGNTPNSEFEFLTGMTMGYLPSGSIAYQQFVKSESPSLVSQLDSLGYHTVAMHPYPASGWKRNDVYTYFGFEEMHFSDYPGGSFAGKQYLRNYVSDDGLYSKIYDVYEAKEDEPLFVFAVTMQNHSGYTGKYNNFTADVRTYVAAYNESVSNYLSLVRYSDKAFENLINYFSAVDEDTVILMFGDHQPNDSVANHLLYAAGIEYDEQDLVTSENRYKVPYIIWSNYEMPLDDVGETSINYLSSLLAEAAGIPKTAEQKFLLSIREKFPVITGRCIIDSTGEYHPISDYESFSELSEYAIIQYNYLFDKDKLTEEFYSLK